MNQIDNLWEFDIRQDTDVSPKRVMEAQAKYLRDMSRGALDAKVKSSPGKGVRSETYVHEFQVGTKAPMEFEYTLFKVRQTIDIYPVQVSSEPSQVDVECHGLDEFKSAVKTILNAESTQRRLRALYSQVASDSGAAIEATVGESVHVDRQVQTMPTDTIETQVTNEAESTLSQNEPAEVTLDDSDTEEATVGDSSFDDLATISGDTSLSEIKSRFNLDLTASGYDTIGEFMRAELGSGARIGARVDRSGMVLQIEETRGKHVTQVNVFPS